MVQRLHLLALLLKALDHILFKYELTVTLTILVGRNKFDVRVEFTLKTTDCPNILNKNCVHRTVVPPVTEAQ